MNHQNKLTYLIIFTLRALITIDMPEKSHDIKKPSCTVTFKFRKMLDFIEAASKIFI